ncbi:hypothetical protein AUEXF2481DRAFT_80673 [Aureobasidium subglaciale EXF-2481]|uniref:Uncharacterized protein n=1 Tax=Aureobasidium subglaciale (strain EXF-2481) TaxID=1043005 RepID=A0A074Z652_AURSE|nr:uncharacterized protein AUEXF2481DRAFT_80673 [Aureobasidium subglaciale EXF-2481]KAI5209778.1 hypothetical protein E4T38_02322 [Aureobasidium subglaciale]KAI5228451.1 hypothetical protein E4T40_02101 [Aureobasidium subglaciale]KAI5231846.1 hypothetical protein E4T41_02321 [Aureobasidium subglaciale]KAI5265708.1 hypothetical protein E4T46_02099 [Aureobasidium subglaciale]KEQ94436.1 hypothetical protein AUEXF2481DRAFT_80673 [Aureobasidium subglaciale EXF-2481]
MTNDLYRQNYGKAKAAVDARNIDDAVATCNTLLADTELPRYYRIKTLVLLASANKNWRQKEDLRLRAEHTWYESRNLHPKGQNDTTDAVLKELRGILDEFKTDQTKNMPLNYEDELSAALAETEIEDLADIADGEIETLADEEYAREQQAKDGPPIELAKSAVADTEAEVAIPGSSPNASFAPASTLKASQDILINQTRDGQTAGTRMAHRTRGVGRRPSS